MKSIFPDKQQQPTEKLLENALGKAYPLWKQIVDFTHASCAAAKDEWKLSSEKLGWSFRINDVKKVIVYLMPFENAFQLSMVFGERAVNNILASDIDESLKKELQQAKAYAEGRGIRIRVNNSSLLKDIFKLIGFKLSK